MSELLARPALGECARPLGDPPVAVDAYTRVRIEEASARAYDRGRRDGAEAVRAEAAATAERVAGALEQARAQVVAEMAALRQREAAADVELAVAIAEAVIGHEPHDGGVALLERVRSVLARLDDQELTIHAHPGDVAALTEGLRAGTAVTVAADPGLQAGEARISGPWARADLTRASALALVRAALEEGP